MSAIMIKTDAKNYKFLFDLATKMGAEVIGLDNEQFEDFTLGKLIEKEKSNKTVSKNEVLKFLKK